MSAFGDVRHETLGIHPKKKALKDTNFEFLPYNGYYFNNLSVNILEQVVQKISDVIFYWDFYRNSTTYTLEKHYMRSFNWFMMYGSSEFTDYIFNRLTPFCEINPERPLNLPKPSLFYIYVNRLNLNILKDEKYFDYKQFRFYHHYDLSKVEQLLRSIYREMNGSEYLRDYDDVVKKKWWSLFNTDKLYNVRWHLAQQKLAKEMEVRDIAQVQKRGAELRKEEKKKKKKEMRNGSRNEEWRYNKEKIKVE